MKLFLRVSICLLLIALSGIFLFNGEVLRNLHDMATVGFASNFESAIQISSPDAEKVQKSPPSPSGSEQKTEASGPGFQRPAVKRISFDRSRQLEQFYSSRNLSLEDLSGETYIIVERFPEDFPEIRSVDQKKSLFHRIMLPAIQLENERIRNLRKQVQNMYQSWEQSGSLSKKKQQFVFKTMEKYKLTVDTNHVIVKDDFVDLLKRVDVIPPSLVLAQAANESGWGTSRFTHRANNIFGEWTYNLSEGIKPAGVDKSSKFRVKVFDNIPESLASYMRNLNTNPAYRKFRKLRHRHRKNLDSLKLVQGLENYSSRGQEYIEAISSLIRYNDYRKYDQN